jgi:hypothetical protein
MHARNRSFFVPYRRNRYGWEIPARRAIVSVDVPWYPLAENSAIAATRTCSRRSPAVRRVRVRWPVATAQSSGSRQTVTETSSTVSAIGGSGFEHFTETASML